MFDDTGHRPHADFKGQDPQTRVTRGPESLSVRLAMWAPEVHMAYMYNALQANWGDAPSQIVESGSGRFWDVGATPERELTDAEFQTMCAYIVKCFEGGTLPQILEDFRFHFVIDGVTRACTHQLVRTRGAAVMQHGGRDNDWRMRGWTMPETIARACDAERYDGTDQAPVIAASGLQHCITDWAPIERWLDGRADAQELSRDQITLGTEIDDYLEQGKRLYSALVDAGIPWQDARRLLWMGTQTFLHISYNYLDLARTLANRLEHIMDWEFNCVAQLMLREVTMHCPSYISSPLMSVSDKAQKAMFAGLTSWPPDGKWPVPPEFANLPRTHRPEQMPFWVLASESIGGEPIRWIPTNGTFPDEAR